MVYIEGTHTAPNSVSGLFAVETTCLGGVWGGRCDFWGFGRRQNVNSDTHTHKPKSARIFQKRLFVTNARHKHEHDDDDMYINGHNTQPPEVAKFLSDINGCWGRWGMVLFIYVYVKYVLSFRMSTTVILIWHIYVCFNNTTGQSENMMVGGSINWLWLTIIFFYIPIERLR